jgi:hypothetical protein
MNAAGLTELTTLRTLVQRANLAAEAKHTALWCLDQLPALYTEFRLNYESRFVDSILRLARAVLKRLAEEGTGQGAGRVADAVVAQLGALHERLGLAPLVLRPAAQPGRGRKKQAV